MTGADARTLEGVRILVASSSGEEIHALRTPLRSAGARVQVARSAQEAVDAFQADPHEVLVADLDDGTPAADFTLIRRIRSLREGRRVPAIAVSGLPWEQHRAPALAAGFSQWISKPATHTVVEVVHALLRRGDARAGIVAPEPVLTDLATTPVSETLRRLWREGRTGDLLVRSRRAVRMVFFDAGRIVFAASNIKKERLGEALMELGTITAEDFHRASALMSERKVRFGDALVAVGVMTTAAVGTSVVRWVEKIALSLFPLETGTAFFEDRPCVIPPEFRVAVPVERVLYMGIRAMKNLELIPPLVGTLDRRLVFSGTPEFAIEPEDVELLGLAKGPVTVRRLAWSSAGLSKERLRAVYALTASSVLVEPGAVAPKPKAPVPTPPAIEAPAPDPRTAIRDEIHRELEQSESLDLQTWIGLPADASYEEQVSALDAREQRYGDLRSHVVGNADLTTDLELLTGRVAMARRMLRRPVVVEPPSPPAPLPEAVAPPAPPAAPESKSRSSKVSMEIEHLLLEANIRMSVSDFRNAAQTYARVVELEPDVAEYRMRLAMALARSSGTARQAEAQFQEAIRLDPQNAELHYQLGMYYTAMKIRSRAIAEFRETVRLNPRHKKGRAELERESPKDSALDALKKILE